MKSSATRAICAIAGCIAIASFASVRADAKVFRWSFQGDVLSLDPQDRRDTFSRDFAGNIMEPLVKFNEKLEIEPALAERWEILEPTLWRFHLRKGVKFSNGNVFNADDVIFTFKRGAAPVSPFRGILRAVKEVRKIATIPSISCSTLRIRSSIATCPICTSMTRNGSKRIMLRRRWNWSRARQSRAISRPIFSERGRSR